MAGIQDVAKKAGVSIGTVSRVLNQSGYASEASRAKVMEAVRELQYRPNELARNLLQNSTRIIAVIVPTLLNPYYCTVTEECEQVLSENGYMTMICSTNGSGSSEEKFLDMLNRSMVDGIVTCTHSLNMEKYKEVRGAIVTFDMMYIPGQISRVRVDHASGGRMAARDLYRAGCRKVLQFRDHEGIEHFPYLDRHVTFEKEALELGMECESVYVRWNEFGDNYRDIVAKETMDQHPDADGIFGTDSTILSCMKYAQKKGKKIPEDIRFVAYDGTWVVDTAFPTVTAICQPIRDLAREAVNMLLARIRQEELPADEKILPVTMRKGMTTMTPEEYSAYLDKERTE